MAEDDNRDVTTVAAPKDADGAQADGAVADSSPFGDVKAEVEGVLTAVTSGLQARNTMFDMPIIDERRALSLYSEAVRMQVKLHAAADYNTVQELRISAVGLEGRFKRFIDARITKIVVIIIALAVFVTPVIWHTDIMDAVKRWLGDNHSLKYIVIGLSGFMLYWIGRASKFSESMPGKSGVALDLVVGMIAAVVVPPVIVVLFFDADGALRDFKPSPELLSFLCGYSLKVILDLLAKVIEKVNAAVRAL